MDCNEAKKEEKQWKCVTKEYVKSPIQKKISRNVVNESGDSRGKRFSEVAFLLFKDEQMQELRLAKLRLKEGDLTLAIVKEGKVIFETKSQGVSGFLLAIEKFGKGLVASSVADKIVGAAAAMLCAYSRVSSVFAVTISEEGIRVLEDNNIIYQFENQVPNILNHDKTDICPFEKLAIGSRDSKEAYAKLKSFAESLAKRNSRKSSTFNRLI